VETVAGEHMKNGKNVHQRILVCYREQSELRSNIKVQIAATKSPTFSMRFAKQSFITRAYNKKKHHHKKVFS
jgi:hypothetical protein